MVVTLQLRQIDVQPGQCLILREISWAGFEEILDEIGVSAYLALGVPELWCYGNSKLQVFVLHEGEYLQVETSPKFGDLPVIEGILQFLKLSKTQGASEARRQFRQWVRSLLV